MMRKGLSAFDTLVFSVAIISTGIGIVGVIIEGTKKRIAAGDEDAKTWRAWGIGLTTTIMVGILFWLWSTAEEAGYFQ
jgi:hypothetical protein